MTSQTELSVGWGHDPYPPGTLVLVEEVGAFAADQLTGTWRPARTIRRDGQDSWLVRHDDCECWVDRWGPAIRPAGRATYIHYVLVRAGLALRLHMLLAWCRTTGRSRWREFVTRAQGKEW